MKKAKIAAALVLALFSIATTSIAQASVIEISIYNTGVDSNGYVLANGSPELHYQLFSVPATASTTDKILADEYPANGAWVHGATVSQWITPNTTSGNGPSGIYDYRLTFTLDNIAGAKLSGKFAADDSAKINLNGVYTGNAASGYGSFSPFSIISGFQVGVNTLDFLVSNSGGGPTGLRVEATNAKVPEPTTVALLGLGLLGVAASRRKAAKK